MNEARTIRGGRTRANFRGCLVGGAVGDALGAAIEFKSHAEIKEQFGPAGLRDYAMAYRRLGAITDDTQMTLFTAEALLRAEHLRQKDPGARVAEVAWHAYLRWLETQGDVVQRRGLPDEDGWLFRLKGLHAVRGPGDTCLSALRKGRMGTPEEPINESKGCGGVMRIAPAGFPPGQPFRTGCELAAITHGHPTGWLAAGYLAQLVHEVAEGASLDEGAVRALDVLRRQPGHEETARAVERALWLSRSPRGSAAEIESIGGGWVGGGGARHRPLRRDGGGELRARRPPGREPLRRQRLHGERGGKPARAGAGRAGHPAALGRPARAAGRDRAGGRRPAPTLRDRHHALRRRAVRHLGPLPGELRGVLRGAQRPKRSGNLLPPRVKCPPTPTTFGGPMNRKLFLSLCAASLSLVPMAVQRR